MPNNMILLETIALTQSAASVTFDNLPTSGYTDLKIVVSGRTTAATDFASIAISFNGSSASFTNKLLQGDGSSVVSASLTNYGGAVGGTSTTASTFSNVEIYIPNYRSSNNKSFSVDSVVENNATAARTTLAAGLWSQTAAITSIGLAPGSGSFDANSTFSLYGIAALGTTPVLAPKATGGNRVENDGTYWIHTFLTSGVFTPQTGLTCDVLVVAGGGGGGKFIGGGGGAGGFRTATGFSVASATNYSVTVGAGGAKGTPYFGISGSDSIFSTITSTGGGGGASYDDASGGSAYTTGRTGGSGGGGAPTNTDNQQGPGGAGNTPSTSPSQGNSGGYGVKVSNYGGGGGGGAGGSGSVSTGTNGGAGGSGSASSITGTSVTYAGGGGGGINTTNTPGAGGSGGGGSGATSTTLVGGNGTANLGGGGGGGGYSAANGGAGGSGVVIIRYPIA
jgi:hypothetical protein